MIFVDVILPLPLGDPYTYAVPAEFENRVQEGYRVIVQFGSKKIYTGIVKRVHTDKPENIAVKDILEVLDDTPIVLNKQLKLWEWISQYYICTMGDVYKAALPAGIKPESETVVVANDDFDEDDELTKREKEIVEAIRNKGNIKATLLGKELGIKNILPMLATLMAKNAISVKEELKQKYKEKTEVRIILPKELDRDKTNILLLSLKNAPKQQELMKFILETPEMSFCNEEGIRRNDLIMKSGCNLQTIKALVDKGLLEQKEIEIGRLEEEAESRNSERNIHELNKEQDEAYHKIQELFKEKNTVLLHGVTSSGKTEVYIHLIKKYIDEGKQVLYLLPEIALTTQITGRLKRVFGDELGVYHSKFPDAERVEIYKKQLSDKPYKIILGVRSSIFLPFTDLGLVIIDEEHEQSYKQQEPAPRYNARNAGIMLAGMFNAKTLLGTATPCLETYSNALNGKYGMVEMMHRFKSVKMPEIKVVDIKRLKHQKRMKGVFSQDMINAINEALRNGEQIILFQNRRGYAPIVQCKACGWVARCEHCDVSLTYHKGTKQMTCHYCGHTYSIPDLCPNCMEPTLANHGAGTEKIEDDIKTIFPNAKTARLDLDTARTRLSYEKIIDAFSNHETDILIGTQMVSKGLDFDNVGVVGILDADTMLNYPDFRSYERAFQMIAQVAGRAGRKNKQGLVILQTRSADAEIINQVVNYDYKSMYETQMEERKLFRYPPYYRLVYIYLKHKDNARLDSLSHMTASVLTNIFKERVLGPDKPPVARIQSLYIRKIVLKIENNASLQKIREILVKTQEWIMSRPESNGLSIYYDVDPL